MKIYVASSNKGKIKEISHLFSDAEIILQSELSGFIEPEETGKTFTENSQIKARCLYDFIKPNMEERDLIIADDSGILIPNLGPNRLGVYTKRERKAWCSENNAEEIAFWQKVVSEAKVNSDAKFTASICVITSSGEESIFENTLDGKLSNPKGENGFGFDPIFAYNTKTLAELSIEQKQEISPRGNALKEVAKKFAN